ncbi:MAG: group 1 truncated hemoglobin [Burkholderiaceae bacterium]|nr:MAG: group 1 truncated hemoglobin [Burkholderiaceae bacterium]
MNKTMIACAVACAALFGAMTCAQAQSAPTAPMPTVQNDSLYQVFGERPGLVKLMDDFMTRLVADPRTGPFFGPANQTRIKAELVDQFCQLTGGPCVYKGVDMKTIHQGLKINKGDFNALVEELQHAMDDQDIPFRDQNKLLAMLAPMHREIITVK